MLTSIPLLSTIIWMPVVAGILMLLSCKHIKKTYVLKYFSLIISILSVLICAYVIYKFKLGIWELQFSEHIAWLPNLGIEYALGVDGFSLPLVMLTSFMTMLVIFGARADISYCAIFLIMQGLMSGVFLAADAILFYIFFEAMMIPMFLLIGLWGGKNRIYATIKFILYTFLGSIFLIIALLYLNHIAQQQGHMGINSFSIATFQNLSLNITEQKWLFWAIFIAFAIKIPMWPVHTWLPDAHVEAPTAGSVILAAITLKMGGYGMLRFLLPIVPIGCETFSTVVIILSLIAIVYIGLVAIVQRDLKKLIAYSSIAHMGFVTLGLFVSFKLLSDAQSISMGIEGAMLQMISHGLISGALFMCVGVLYKRMHTREISSYGGVANPMPVFAAFFMLFALANLGLPGTSGFVGEFLIILTVFKANFWYAFSAALSLILGVAYTLWMYKRVMFGEIANEAVAALKDLDIDEKIVFTLLASVILFFGLWPNPLLELMHGSVDHFVAKLIQLK